MESNVVPWPKVALSDLFYLKQGKYASPNEMEEQESLDFPFPVYGANGILGYARREMYSLPQVLITCRGSNCGLIQKTSAHAWVSNNAIACVPKDGVHADFFYYLFQIEPFVDVITGSAQPQITIGQLGTKKVTCPPLSDQRAIASVLGSLDEQIETLRRQNATLEQLAQTLFRAWFVDFEPVKAKRAGLAPACLDDQTAALFPDEFEEQGGREIPKGWHFGQLNEAYEVFDNRRVPLSGKQRAERAGSYPYYGAASVMDYIDGYLFDGIYLLTGEDGSVADKNGFPITQYVWGKIWVNNHAHVLQGKSPICTEHLMLSLQQTNISGFVNGAVQAKLNQGNLARIPFVVPSPEVAKEFAEIIQPFYTLVRANTEQARTLSQIRDALLPRLLSGALRVPESLLANEEFAAASEEFAQLSLDV